MRSLYKKYATRHTAIIIAVSLIAIFLVNLLGYVFVKSESAVYYWDISAYWKNALDLLDVFRLSFSNGVTTVLQSTSTDYNYLPIVPLLPFLSILGTGRTVFVLTIINIYIVPFALITAYAATKLFAIKNNRKKILFYSSALFVSLFFPPVLAPALEGRVDAISLISVSLILLLYSVTRFKRYRHFIILGILISSMLIFRRYFSYWALSFFLSYGLFSLVHAWLCSNKKINKNFWLHIKKPFFGLIIAGVTVITIMMVGFRDVFLRYLTEDYSDMYSAYYFGDSWSQVSYFVQFFGILSILVALFSIYLSLTKYRKMLVGKITIFILIQTIVIFLAFTKTQTFGLHHYYMLTPIFLWSLFVVLKFFLDKKGPTRYLYLIVIICISTSALVSFTGAKTNPHVITKSIFGATKELSPIVRGDITELNNITTYLESVMSPGEYVYVLSSSHTFNDDILRNTRLPNSLTINVSGAAHVDKRDGFPNYFFDAEYVAVASPVQTHLEQGSQDVVKYPAQLILSGAAKNLQKLQSFSLDKGIIVTVYKKKHSYDTSFVKNIHDHFKQKYPEYPQLNNIHSLEEQY